MDWVFTVLLSEQEQCPCLILTPSNRLVVQLNTPKLLESRIDRLTIPTHQVDNTISRPRTKQTDGHRQTPGKR
jgi:hypothetical protein